MRCRTENFMRTKTSPDKYDSRMRETGNFVQLTCLDTALCEQPASLAMNVGVLPSLWRVSMIVFWTTVRSAVFPMIV